MFEKKCPSCKNKIENKFYFCPYCGSNIMKEKESSDFGLLGDDDRVSMPNVNKGMPLGLNNIFNGLIKQLTKEMSNLEEDKPNEKNETKKPRNISISISSMNGGKPEIKISGMANKLAGSASEKPVQIQQISMTEDMAKRISKLPRVEAEAKVRRLSNKVIYEIELPEIKNKSDILINKLENSLEIKAFADDKVYFKAIPVNLPIMKYELENGILFLEFKSA